MIEQRASIDRPGEATENGDADRDNDILNGLGHGRGRSHLLGRRRSGDGEVGSVTARSSAAYRNAELGYVSGRKVALS